MAIKLSQLGGSGFNFSFFSEELLMASGASGDVITITPPAGKKAALLILAANDTPESDVQILLGSDVVFSGSLGSRTGEGLATFKVGLASGLTAGTSTVTVLGVVDKIINNAAGQSIIVRKSSGATTQAIRYAFGYGE
jgi:hypothetical protein